MRVATSFARRPPVSWPSGRFGRVLRCDSLRPQHSRGLVPGANRRRPVGRILLAAVVDRREGVEPVSSLSQSHCGGDRCEEGPF